MKRKNWLLAAALVVISSATVFGLSQAHQPMGSGSTQTEEWFEYVDNNYPGGPSNPLNYQRITAPSCEGDDALCAIRVLSDQEIDPKPDATALSAIQTEITNAVVNQTPTDDVRLKD